MKEHRLAKSISDASWSELCRKLEYKVKDHGGILIKVPRTYASSQICSCCGRKDPKIKDLSIRRWTCPSCGANHDRDVNAAKNIMKKALRCLHHRPLSKTTLSTVGRTGSKACVESVRRRIFG